ncbi:twin-arginine translocation signal domain-containing protein [Bradyrhizobium sp. GCM10027634]|uniref:twin-arginine translocation signal domain-containing protein n=1 Tax=unclassified Bradyrhizobium TaxID=2631580 RepID=UPI00188C2C6C|nr:MULTISPECIES: twin-arginine translocation signal domain-containing protein [unclassified Bradyrhizobium]MDN5003948.1 twin-arginine translocation signal domain-containing protein [Bradyrhizobium sp. WYCCWR 12677]QOZ44876.1 twin-arginine translocation (Tat) [Bradyrhizobium sp. CCBAU 53340]
MERRNFLKLAFGVAASAAALTAAAQAAPLAPQPLGDVGLPQDHPEVRPAVTSSEEAAQLKPEQVRWHGRHWGWHHRHWGWHHRHWGWRHRWHRRHWRHW